MSLTNERMTLEGKKKGLIQQERCNKSVINEGVMLWKKNKGRRKDIEKEDKEKIMDKDSHRERGQTGYKKKKKRKKTEIDLKDNG